MTTTFKADGTGTFYRTNKGSHRHASSFCANFRRQITSGDIVAIPATEVADWEPCIACCDDATIAEAAQVAAAKPAQCPNNQGVTRPGRIYSSCKVCGKEGKVNRSTGSIRAHAPAN